MSDFAVCEVGLFAAQETKVCKGCEKEFPIEMFSLNIRNNRASKKTYRHPYCDDCRKEYQAQYYRDRVAANPEYGKKSSRRATLAKYGLTPEEYQVIFELQEGKCAICGNKPGGNGVSRHNLVVDHDHDTGKVRALLCDFCNRGLGIFRDSPELLEQAARYLRLHEGQGEM